MNFSPQDLCGPVRKAREAKGWSQKELADRAGIGKTAVFDLEHGNPGVRLNTLLAVLEVLNMDLELVQPEGSESPPFSEPFTERLPEHLL